MGHIQTSPLTAESSGAGAAPAIVHETLRSAGDPLEPGVRTFMERRFGHDFSRVRVHADERAAESAFDIHARAYTAGNHIVFRPGQYAPDTPPGRRLIAHELTHVMQQNAGGDPAIVQLDRGAPNAKTWTGAPPECGPTFCRPIDAEWEAESERAAMLSSILRTGPLRSSEVAHLYIDSLP